MFDLSKDKASYMLGAASANASTKLNAFDRVLIKAGCGNYNLVRVSSILPPGAKEVDNISYPEGSLLPIAYAEIIANPEMESGIIISAAIAIAIPRNSRKPGVIMEFSDFCKEETAISEVRKMAICSMNDRNEKEYDIVIRSSTFKHVKGYYSCAFAYVAIM